MIPYSFLDLALVLETDQGLNDTYNRLVNTAQFAEHKGFKRFWMAEHHNMESVASSATTILIGHVAAHTKKIRVGSGGIMLPNHSPLAITEAFGTLEAIHGERIDLGLGRAPGTDTNTARLLRSDFYENAQKFPVNVQIIQQLQSLDNCTNTIRAIPGEGSKFPIWILGSSTESAYLAAELGLPYAFASHFAPKEMAAAFKIYTERFKPSAQLQQPYKMACINIVIGSTKSEAAYEASPLYQMFLNIIRNTRTKMVAPSMDIYASMEEHEMGILNTMLMHSVIGTADDLKEINQLISDYDIQEIMMTCPVFTQSIREKSMSALATLLAG